jgi:hypothetical protein
MARCRAFKITIASQDGRPGGTMRILATSAAAARQKFAAEFPERAIYSVTPWASNR